MIIIIEGNEGTGKTRLAEQISNQTGYEILHRVQPKNEEEKARMMGEYLQAIKKGKNMIFDRCWYSEMVYGPIMRDKSYIDFPQMYELERMLAGTGAMIIHCTGPKAAVWKRCQQRGEDYITKRETFDDIHEAFNKLFSTVPHLIPIVTYEYKEV